ncbi:MAG TPA: hypothetical protein PLO51_02005, partial [Candidatus Micrarchaeota archaeon]|nr:hypothetical protein [Candidatus Micrarchaeota archaeon]
MYLSRSEEMALLPWLDKREALALIGPRQAGKTTLARRLYEIWLDRGKPAAFFDLESIDAPKDAKKL